MATFSHSLFLSYERNRIKSFWADANLEKNQSKISRYPSSLLLIEGSPQTINLVRPYFQFETYNKYLNYELDLDFHTNKDEEYIREKSKKALTQALTETLSLSAQNEFAEGLPKFFKENLIEELMSEFVKTLRVYKIVNGQFQIDLNFSPKVTPYFNYDSELSSNQLIRWDNIKAHDLELETINENIVNKIFKTEIPYNNEPFQYKGGQISLWFKLLDIVPDLQFQGAENRVASGFIRFRKYLKAPHLESGIKLSGNSTLKFEDIQFKSFNEREAYITVDVIQEFNYKNPTPKLKRVEFTFGKLVEHNFPKESSEDSLFTGDFILSGTYLKNGKNYDFDTILDSLIFDFEKGNFLRDSNIKTMIKSKTATQQMKGRIQNNINDQFRNELALELIQKLKLGSVQYFQGEKK